MVNATLTVNANLMVNVTPMVDADDPVVSTNQGRAKVHSECKLIDLVPLVHTSSKIHLQENTTSKQE